MEKSGELSQRDSSVGADGKVRPRQHKTKSEWDKTESLREMPLEAPDTAEAIPATHETPVAPEEAAVQETPQAPVPEEFYEMVRRITKAGGSTGCGKGGYRYRRGRWRGDDDDS